MNAASLPTRSQSTSPRDLSPAERRFASSLARALVDRAGRQPRPPFCRCCYCRDFFLTDEFEARKQNCRLRRGKVLCPKCAGGE